MSTSGGEPRIRRADIAIRTITARDNAAVRELYRATYMPYADDAPIEIRGAVTEYVEQSLADDLADPFKHYMTHPRTGFFVAEAADPAAGRGRKVIAGMLGVDHWEGDEKIAQLRRVAVSSRFRRQGIGRRLMGFAEQWAVEHGYTSMRFYTVEQLVEAIAMYESLGYRLVQKHEFGPVVGREYEKPLGPSSA